MELNAIIEHAKKLLVKDGFLAPVLFIDSIDNKSYIVGLHNMKDKAEMMMFAGLKMREQGVQIKKASFLSEGWAVEIKTKNYKKEENIEPSKHPDRIEVIILISWDLIENKKDAFVQKFEKIGKDINFLPGHNETLDKELKKDSRFYLLEFFVKGYLEPEETKKKLNQAGKNFGWGRTR